MWETILGYLSLESVAGLLMTGLAAAMAAVGRWAWVRRWGLERAVQCVESGVRQTYEEFVRGAKAEDPDGKLDSDQRKEAVSRALATAFDFARTEGVDLLDYYARSYLPVLVDRVVRKLRGEDSWTKWVPAPFGGSSPAED